jgi:hypothetical protein
MTVLVRVVVIVDKRPVLLSERALQIIKPAILWQ